MKNRTAVVTGAGSGIGRSVTLKLAKEGYRVIAVGRTGEKLKETAKLCSEFSGDVEPLIMDVSKKEQILSGFAPLETVDIIVANAGICDQGRLDEDRADDVWERVMATNVDSVWYLFRALSGKLNNDGRCVVISSGLGKLGRAGYGAYTASKHAAIGLVKCFSKELAPKNITVNAVCPGWVETSMSAADIVRTAKVENTTPETIREKALENIPLHRFVTPGEVASLVGWLTSKESGAVTGQAYNISAGEFFV